MKQMHKIILSSKRLENQNLSLRELAGRMEGKIQRDRSPINIQSQPDMFSNIKYFEKQFRLKKYEIEDLYLLRRAANKGGGGMQAGLYGDQVSQMGAAGMQD